MAPCAPGAAILGCEEAAQLLDFNLEEEKRADQKLTDVAQQLNLRGADARAYTCCDIDGNGCAEQGGKRRRAPSLLRILPPRRPRWSKGR